MLKYFLIALVVLVLIPTILWGFPGVWALGAVLPAFFFAATFAHVRGSQGLKGVADSEQRIEFRPSILVLGGVFTLISGAISVMAMWASQAPSHIVVAHSAVVDASAHAVWKQVGDVSVRTTWSSWVIDADPIGAGGPAKMGSTYRGMLLLEQQQLPTTFEVIEFKENEGFAWAIKPEAGSKIENFVERIALEAIGEQQTRVTYSLEYDVNSTLARLGERIAMRGPSSRMLESSLERLRIRAMGAL